MALVWKMVTRPYSLTIIVVYTIWLTFETYMASNQSGCMGGKWHLIKGPSSGVLYGSHLGAMASNQLGRWQLIKGPPSGVLHGSHLGAMA